MTGRRTWYAAALSILLIASSCGGALGRRAPSASALAARSEPARTAPVSTTTAVTAPPTTQAPPALPAPAALTPLVSPAAAGEGTWQPAPGSSAPGGFGIYTTELRPGPGHPPAGIAWIDPRATQLALYAGSGEPYGAWPRQGYVPSAQQPGLLAAFNSGFKIYAYRAGWYEQGRTAMPLQNGAASLVIFNDGTATVGEWGRDVGLSPTVEAVRQNLTLLVDNAAPAANVGVAGDWGATLHGVNQNWRSGIGVTSAGDIVYVAGPTLDAPLLARLLIAAGAVRAMELDINPEWVSFATYTHSGSAISGTDLLPGMYFQPAHFLAPDSRDFFAVFAR